MRDRRRKSAGVIRPLEQLDSRILLANFNDLSNIVFENSLNGRFSHIKGPFNPADVGVGGFQFVNNGYRPFFVFTNFPASHAKAAQGHSAVSPAELASQVRLFQQSLLSQSSAGHNKPASGH